MARLANERRGRLSSRCLPRRVPLFECLGVTLTSGGEVPAEFVTHGHVPVPRCLGDRRAMPGGLVKGEGEISGVLKSGCLVIG
mgnify:CR=1 FL=1